VAKTYLAATPSAPVNELVLLSPLVRPARVYYPPGGHEGWGVAAGYELQALTAGLRVISPIDMTPDTPLLRSIADNASTVRDLLTCPLPGVEQLALFPLADAVASPHPSAVGIPASVVPAFHGGLLGSGAVHKTIALRLDGGRLPRYNAWSLAERVLRVGTSAWQVPPLPLTLNAPAWGHPPGRSPSCASMASALHMWVGALGPG
jgi:predicted component of type VI protein secretion system